MGALKFPSVHVENGQAAVIKENAGFLFFVPIRADSGSFSYKAFYSKSGNFAVDKQAAASGSMEFSRQSINVRGIGLSVEPGKSAESVNITLVRKNSNASIAGTSVTDPNLVEVSKLEFEGFSSEEESHEVLVRFLKELQRARGEEKEASD